MSNLRNWLKTGLESEGDPDVTTHEGETPKKDFSDASNPNTTNVDVADPAVADLDPASKDLPESKVDDQGHQETRSTEESEHGEHDNDHVEPKDVDGVAEPKKEEATVKADENETGGDNETPESDDKVKPTEDGHGEAITSDTPNATDESGKPSNESEEGEGGEQEYAEGEGGEQEEEEYAEDEDDGFDADVQAVTGTRQRMDEVEGHIDHFNRATDALEAYQNILSEALEHHDGIRPETAEAIRIGLEGYDISFGGTEVVPAMEEFGVTASRHKSTYVSIESVSDKLKSVGEAIKRAIAKLFDMLYEMWTAATGGAARARKRLSKLVKRADNVKEGEGHVRTTIQGPAKLMIGKEFMGNDLRGVEPMLEVAKYMYRDWPRQATGLTSAAAGVFVKTSKELSGKSETDLAILSAAMNDYLKLPARHLGKVPGATEASTSELPSALQRHESVQRSDRTPGNYAIVQWIDRKAINTSSHPDGQQVGDILRVFHAPSKVFQVGFMQLHSGERVKGEESYEVPTPKQMKSMAGRLDALLEAVEKSGENRQEYKRAKADIDKAIADIEKNAADGDSTVRRAMISGLQGLSRFLTQPAGQFNGYVISTVNAFMAIMSHNLDALEKEFGTKSSKTYKGKAEETEDKTSMVPA